MGKRTEYTPRSKIRQSLRQLWLRSRERASSLKRDNYTCQKCHRKQSKAKGKEFAVCVHHKNQIDWEELIDLVYERLLQKPEDLETLCNDCHDEIHMKPLQKLILNELKEQHEHMLKEVNASLFKIHPSWKKHKKEVKK